MMNEKLGRLQIQATELADALRGIEELLESRNRNGGVNILVRWAAENAQSLSEGIDELES